MIGCISDAPPAREPVRYAASALRNIYQSSVIPFFTVIRPQEPRKNKLTECKILSLSISISMLLAVDLSVMSFSAHCAFLGSSVRGTQGGHDDHDDHHLMEARLE